MKIRNANRPDDVECAVAIDEAQNGSLDRAAYIRSVSDRGFLSVAAVDDDVRAFCCLDHGYFFAKPFVSLLVVSSDARRQGLGIGLLQHCANMYPEVWTSTNRSNGPMRKLLKKAGWLYCGEVSGLDEGDPERFYRTA